MEKSRDSNNRVMGKFTHDGQVFEVYQRGGYMSKQGWVGEPAYISVSTVIDNIHSLIGVVRGDLSLEGEEVLMRITHTRLLGEASEFFVPEEVWYGRKISK